MKEIAAPSSVFGAGAPGTRDLTTQYRYDVGGRVSRRIDANRMSTWHVYDAAGQLTHTISALGEVSESRYDAVGRLVYRRRCVDPLGREHGRRLRRHCRCGFVLPPATANDQRDYVVYDNDGRARFTLTTTGSSGWTISENRHDANGNVIEARRYDKFLPNARVAASIPPARPGITVSEIQRRTQCHAGVPATTRQATLAGVQRTRFAYDANNRLRFTVDPSGSIEESVYDAAGNVVSTIRFASRPTLDGTHRKCDQRRGRPQRCRQSVTHSCLRRRSIDCVTRSMRSARSVRGVRRTGQRRQNRALGHPPEADAVHRKRDRRGAGGRAGQRRRSSRASSTTPAIACASPSMRWARSARTCTTRSETSSSPRASPAAPPRGFPRSPRARSMRRSTRCAATSTTRSPVSPTTRATACASRSMRSARSAKSVYDATWATWW